MAVPVRSGVPEAVPQVEGVAEVTGDEDTVAVALTVAQGDAVPEDERVSRAEADVEEE